MNKTTIKCIIIACISIIFIISLYVVQNKKDYTLICKYNGTTPNYYETMKFEFTNDELSKFYREEEVLKIDEESYNKYKEQIENIKDDVKSQENDYFKYNYKEENNKFTINTYIDVKTLNEFFNSYLSNQNIKGDSTSNEIKNILESNSYNCTISK